MIIPIKCFSCGTVIADKYRYYVEEVRKQKLEKKMDIDKVIYLTKEFSTKTPEGAIRLGSPSDVSEFARDLYIALRLSDQKGLKRVVVETPKGSGLAEAIRDRVGKASFGN